MSARLRLFLTDNGIFVVTTHLFDGKKSLPLDIEPRNAVSLWLTLPAQQFLTKRKKVGT